MPELSPILNRFQPSKIVQTTDLVAKLKKEGRTLYDFSMGEPDFDTPMHIQEAAIAAMKRGETRYTPVDGSFACKEAVQRKFSRDDNLDFDLKQIAVGSGAKSLLANILQTITQEDDEVILATPCWTSHIGMIQLFGGHPVAVETTLENGFRMTAESLQNAITDKTRALLTCAPSNPSGAVYCRQELEQLADVLRKYKDIWIVTDDLYEHIVFDGRECLNLLNVAPDLADRTILVNGISKAFAMTGWRIGYAAGPVNLVNAVRKVMSQATGCPCSISQAAAIAALDGPMDSVQEFVHAFENRRNRAVEVLNDAAGLKCASPDGAFYLFPSCAGVIGKTTPEGKLIESSTDFCNYLLETHSVVTVPGAAFEMDPHVRISIATADDDLDEGMKRIREAANSLT